MDTRLTLSYANAESSPYGDGPEEEGVTGLDGAPLIAGQDFAWGSL